MRQGSVLNIVFNFFLFDMLSSLARLGDNLRVPVDAEPGYEALRAGGAMGNECVVCGRHVCKVRGKGG